MEAEPRSPSDIEKAHWIDRAMENKPQNFLEVSNTNTEEGDVLAIVSNVEEGPQPQATGVLEEETRWVTGIPLFTFIATTTVVIFLILLDTSIISTAIPRITADFNSLSDVGWYGSSYLLASAAVQPLTGKIFENFDMKAIYQPAPEGLLANPYSGHILRFLGFLSWDLYSAG